MHKADGYIPRLPVMSEACRHFTPDTINPTAGIGVCGAGKGAHWPMVRHACGGHWPRNTAQFFLSIKRDGLDSERLDATPKTPRCANPPSARLSLPRHVGSGA